MEQILANKKQAISYLFGELSTGERDLMEEQIFLDEDFGLFVNDVENDLIDEYIRGELGAEEKERFETAYLTSENRRDKVRASRILNSKLLNENQAKKTAEKIFPFWQSLANFFRVPSLAWAGGLAVVLLVLLSGFWILNRFPIIRDSAAVDEEPLTTPTQFPSPQIVQPVPDQSSKANGSLEDRKDLTNTNAPQKSEENKPNRGSQAPTGPLRQKVFAFTLMPPLRSSGSTVLKIPVEAKTVRLHLFDNFGDQYVRYLVELNDGGGNSVWGQEVVASNRRPQKSITVNVPGIKLKAGSYELAVSGISPEGNVEEVSFYNFVVQKSGIKQE